MDNIGPITLDDFDDWYSAQWQSVKGQQDLAEFLERKIKKAADTIVGDGCRLPSVVINKICESAGCPEVAVSILKFEIKHS
jgi:hypothetical protein